mmetsp:Transcript_12872/g.35550  ORF Transcript_12872/g.35550 Transcript_12872/m.35550 type:complete len:244 (+) Transcript_12872:1033-1764(+)
MNARTFACSLRMYLTCSYVYAPSQVHHHHPHCMSYQRRSRVQCLILDPLLSPISSCCDSSTFGGRSSTPICFAFSSARRANFSALRDNQPSNLACASGIATVTAVTGTLAATMASTRGLMRFCKEYPSKGGKDSSTALSSSSPRYCFRKSILGRRLLSRLRCSTVGAPTMSLRMEGHTLSRYSTLPCRLVVVNPTTCGDWYSIRRTSAASRPSWYRRYPTTRLILGRALVVSLGYLSSMRAIS